MIEGKRFTPPTLLYSNIPIVRLSRIQLTPNTFTKHTERIIKFLGLSIEGKFF